MRHVLIIILCLVLIVLPVPLAKPEEPRTYDIVIYGGSFASRAAAVQAAGLLPGNARILMVVPEEALGYIGTVGGQNFFDVRRWKGEMVTRGSFVPLWEAFGQGYPVKAMADLLSRQVTEAGRGRVETVYNHEIEEVFKDLQGNIRELSIRPVTRDPRTLKVSWNGSPLRIRARIFIDGSGTGRLARLAGAYHTIGRERSQGDVHQQAATLMFKVKGIDAYRAAAYRSPDGQQEFTFLRDASGSWIGYGGKDFVERDPVLEDYNNSPHPFRIKGYNIAEDEPGTWWVNALLIFRVDGRKQEIDRGTARWPIGSKNTISTDEAMELARKELQSDLFLTAFRRFPGFENARLLRDEAGYPVTGRVLYLRESIHTVNREGGFALTGEEVRGAGDAAAPGTDQDNYPSRIGLGRYYLDVNGYLETEAVQTIELPANASYIPAEVLLTANVPNLLVPGYAQNSDSAAWSMMRVIPNLNVCGDAAVAIAASSVIHGEAPARITATRIADVQQALAKAGVRLNKDQE